MPPLPLPCSLRRIVPLACMLWTSSALSAAPASAGPNLVENGDFESRGGWTSNWAWSKADSSLEIDRSRGEAHSGKGALLVTSLKPATTQWHSTPFTLKAGQAYRLSFMYRGEGVSQLHAVVRMIRPNWTAYHKTNHTILPEWNRAEDLFVASADKEDVALFFSFEDAGRVWIDNVVLNEIDLPVAKPTRTENLLNNGDFEVSVSGDDWIVPANSRNHIRRDTTERKSGSASLRVEGARDFLSAPLLLTENCPHVISGWVRADRPDTPVTFELKSGRTVRFSKTFTVGPEWTRCEISGASMLKERFFYVSLRKSGNGAAWFDGIALHEGDRPPAGEPPARREVGVELQGEGRVYTTEHPPEVVFTLNRGSPRSAPREETLEWRLDDWRGDTFQTGRVIVRVGETSVRTTLRPTKFGLHHLVVRGRDTSVNGTHFAYFSPPPKIAPADSRFGNHFSHNSTDVFEMAQRIGCLWGRAHWPPGATQWKSVEPAKGEFSFSERLQKRLAAGEMALLGMIDTTPPWAAAPDDASWLARNRAYGTVMPESIDDWRNYVRTVAKAHPQITHWEIFNEPNVPIFWRGTREDLLKLHVAASEELRRANPAIKVVGGVSSSQLQQAGALRSVDATVEHPYSHGRTVDERVTENRAAFARRRATLDKAGGKHVALWNTEYGPGDWGSVRAPGNMDQRVRAVEYMIKHTVAQLDQIERFFPYLMASDVISEHTQLEPDHVPRLGLAGYATVIRFTDGAEPIGEVPGTTPDVRAFGVRRDGHLTIFVWSRTPGKTLSPRRADGVEVFDEMGNSIPMPASIGRLPVILTGKPEALLQTGLFTPRL